jgi:hypothetical protein
MQSPIIDIDQEPGGDARPQPRRRPGLGSLLIPSLILLLAAGLFDALFDGDDMDELDGYVVSAWRAVEDTAESAFHHMARTHLSEAETIGFGPSQGG